MIEAAVLVETMPISAFRPRTPEYPQQDLARALDAGVPARWVTGDAVYGQSHKLRKAFEDRGRV